MRWSTLSLSSSTNRFFPQFANWRQSWKLGVASISRSNDLLLDIGRIDVADVAPAAAATTPPAPELDEKEKLRRQRISQANSGKTPWNKGRQHRPGGVRVGA